MKAIAAGLAPLILLVACGPKVPAESSKTAASSNSPIIKTSTSAAPRNGPFGLAMGERIEEVEATQLKPGWYKVNKTPIDSSEFEGVVVEAYPETGICFIKAIGQNIEGDDGGQKLRAQIDDLASAMETKYGKSKHTDYCDSGSSSCNPGYWTMHVSNGARTYSYAWDLKTPLNGIGEAYVGAAATSGLKGYAVIEYYSAKKNECSAAKAKAGAAAL